MNSYLLGKAEAQLDIVPGLMPSAYVFGRLDAKQKKHASKNKPGLDWVEDKSVKGGGYYRKAKPASKKTSTVAKIAAATLLAGAGTAAIASQRKQNTNKRISNAVPPIISSVVSKKTVNKKAIVAASVGTATAIGTGAAIIANNKAKSSIKNPAPESRMPNTAKTEFKQVKDPWNESPDIQDPWDETTKSQTPNTATPMISALPSAQYKAKFSEEKDPWDEKLAQNTTKSGNTTPVTTNSDIPALPAAKQVEYKRPFASKSPKLRKLINKAKREQSELEKARDKVELGQRLQQNTASPADMVRGVDVEMAAQEKIANLEARSPKRTPAGLATIRGESKNSVRVADLDKPAQKPSKKKEESESVVLENPTLDVPSNASDLDKPKSRKAETARERKRRIRQENKELKQELGELTVGAAQKKFLKESRKKALNTIVPGMALGDKVEFALKIKDDKAKLEAWADELEKAGTEEVSRREFFTKSRNFVARQTAKKPSMATDELKRGAEVSQDFFDKLFDRGDNIILQGGRNRLGSGNRKIQVTKQEFERITKDYTNADRRALRNFLDLIKFPLP